MNELTKKFYWFIFTGAFSLFIFLWTITFKQFENLPYYNPFDFNSEDWQDKLAPIAILKGERHEDLIEIQSQLDSATKIMSIDFRKYLNKSLTYDLIMRTNLVTVESMTNEQNINKFNTRHKNLVAFVNNLKYQLISEIKLWELFGDYSITYLYDKASFDLPQFRADFIRQYNKLRALELNWKETIPTTFVTGEMILAIAIIFLSSMFTIGLGYFMIAILLPIGYEIWKEKIEAPRRKP